MAIADYNKIFSESHPKELTLVFTDDLHEIILHNEDIYKESLQIEESICEEEDLLYGQCNASSLRIRVVNSHSFIGMKLHAYLSLRGVNERLIDSNNNKLVNNDGDYLVGYNLNDSVSIDLGIYKVWSDKPTNDRVWRDLICYDEMYDINNADVTTWFASLTFPMTIKNFRDSFFNHLGIEQEEVTLINDTYSTKGGFSVDGELSGQTVIEAICELNGVFGKITKDGKFKYVSLPSSETVTYEWYIKDSGGYEDYETDLITGIVARQEDNDVGTTVGTVDNPYVMQGNPLIYGDEGNQTLTTALTNLLNKIKDFSYRPFSIKTFANPVLSPGTSVIFSTKNQTISSFVARRYLTGIQSMKDDFTALGNKKRSAEINAQANQIIRTAGKQHVLENDVDKLNSEVFYIDPQTGTVTSKITQMANTIVLKVQATQGGVSKIVQAALTASTGGTEFKVSADNISFIANNKIKLTANNLEIDSTNFKVTSAGAITCTSGSIGGWDINANSLYKGGSIISPSGSITLKQSASASSGLICDYNGIHWYRGSSTAALDVLGVDTNTGYVILDADSIYAEEEFYYKNDSFETWLNTKPSKSDFHGGTATVTFSNGEGSIAFTTVGVTSRPEGLMVASVNSASILVTYIYDQSTTEVKLWAYDVANSGWYNGDVKVIWSCYQWI